MSNTHGVTRRIARKELHQFFASPVAWLFLAAFLAVSLFVFFWVESFFARNIADVRPLFEWMPLLLIFLSAALAMRMWSDERRQGTLEYLLTRPVPLWRFVLGKFLACFSLLLLALLGTLPLPFTVAFLGELDWGPVIAGYLAAALLGAAYLSGSLLVSARTDNAMVSLMGSVALCGLLYLIGSPVLTGFFGDSVGQFLRLLGTGSRFESITRGVIDLRDLFYYFALTTLFLALTVYSLEAGRWAHNRTPRHRQWQLASALLAANLLVGGVWLQQLPSLRADVTRGQLYSISEPSQALLEQLEEPLLIRGYFSERTHPLLAPLVPQLRDLIREYGVVGGDRVRVEFVDPARDPEKEQEANEDYGIVSTPFQIADRYQAALVNAYFNVLVQYGGEYVTLGFDDLIEVKSSAGGQPEVVLRNAEFDLTRAVRDVLYSYRNDGDLFAQLDGPVRFVAYVSRDELLPPMLREYRDAIAATLEDTRAEAGDRFSVEFIEPEAGDGAVARRIEEEWGFQPMLASLGDTQTFYFYLTLENDRQVVQLPTGAFDAGQFEGSLEAALKRFASGFTKSVALSVPEPAGGPMARFQGSQGHSFTSFEQLLGEDYTVLREDLSDGTVDPTADVLVVVAPESLGEAELFAMDQYLMRGGTVMLATSPYSVQTAGGQLTMERRDSGLGPWLTHHGLRLAETLVLDEQHTMFPVPVIRRVGGFEFRDMQFVEYPWFIDVRPPGLNTEHPITRGLPSLTLAWPSPIELDDADERERTVLLESSPRAWRSDALDVMPTVDEQGVSTLAAPAETAREVLAVLSSGRFDSYFDRVPELSASNPTDPGADGGPEEPVRSLIRRSPESARLLLVASSDFLSDQVMSGVIAASGTRYLGPLEFMLNAIDYALEDASLLDIRSRAHFNRTLPPMPSSEQALLEYLNYGIAIAYLAALWAVLAARRRARYARYLEELAA